VVGGGSVYLFELLTPDAQTWVDEHVSPDRQIFGDGLAVEWRYAAALAEGMRQDGLLIDGGEVAS
jgi:hypothetical protein